MVGHRAKDVIDTRTEFNGGGRLYSIGCFFANELVWSTSNYSYTLKDVYPIYHLSETDHNVALHFDQISSRQ